MEFLIEAGANLYLENKDKETPLSISQRLAEKGDNYQKIWELIEKQC